ncbi:CDP-diacylglycerol--serine O-phosphatidyltransferase [Brackiella oedipodis]|uniref:CDP-diacylglycerol--serine O-phosphatidyltransferase n=1 Tax=Brackiella oedipodis TaxID=124225 RepID=UPI000AD64473|nr:CDP-diacylglycerol--serine O-phosphatidyltransferase [Brackiella oedipodis]
MRTQSQPPNHPAYFLLPNAFTTANLFGGFYSMLAAMNQKFELAAIALFAAMIMDAMDGRVARLTHTQSTFGEQYDSMADIVSFGIAPAVLTYSYVLHDIGRLGWMAAFIYVAGAAIRLARFNTNIEVVDSRFFQGLPSPSAAALTAGFVWLSVDNKLPIYSHSMTVWLAFAITVYAGISMISNAPFFSGKSMQKGNKKFPAALMVLLVLAFALLLLNPPITISVFFLTYALSGWVLYFIHIRRAKKLGRRYKANRLLLKPKDESENIEP